MKKDRNLSGGISLNKRREPISNTNLLMAITVCTFFGMYGIAMAVWKGGFLNPQQFLDLFNNNAFLLIIACGLNMVMISGGIDISGGGITALVTMVCVVYLEDHGGTVLGSILIALGIGLAFGLVQGILVAYLDIQPFIVTLAGMFFARGMITIVSIAPRTASQEAFLKLKQTRITLPGIGYYGKTGNFIPAQIEPGVIVAIAIVIIVAIILKWTRFGRNLYAIGGNSQSALTLGINVRKTKFFAYLLAGLFSGISGYVYLLHTGAGDAANAAQAEMQAIASNIIGGTLLTGGVGNVIGTLFGMLSLKTITNIVIASGLTKPYYQSITTGLMLCFFILLQSVILAVRERRSAKSLIPEWMKFKRHEKCES